MCFGGLPVLISFSPTSTVLKGQIIDNQSTFNIYCEVRPFAKLAFDFNLSSCIFEDSFDHEQAYTRSLDMAVQSFNQVR